MTAREVTEVRVWVCTSCGWSTTRERPSRGRGDQNAQGRHKVYGGPTQTKEWGTYLTRWRWCGPVEEWIAKRPEGAA